MLQGNVNTGANKNGKYESKRVAKKQDIDGKLTLYDGRTGKPFDTDVMVGYMYTLKLNHMIDDKIHARSTGPYSMITQQPLGGKSSVSAVRDLVRWKFGRWKLMEQRIASKNFLTYKSDDVSGRFRVYEAMVTGKNIGAPEIPESFKVLVKEMNTLCLNVEMLSEEGENCGTSR